MAINFDSLPQTKPNGFLIDKDFYKGTIIEAKMRTPKNGGAEYLAVTFSLTDKDGNAKGKLWDNFFDIDKELPRYKLGRFITALRLPLSGSFELKDLCKIIVNKSVIVDVGVDEKNTPPRNQVDVFNAEIYYHPSEWAALLGVAAEDTHTNSDAVDAPFDAEDSAEPVTDAAGDDY